MCTQQNVLLESRVCTLQNLLPGVIFCDFDIASIWTDCAICLQCGLLEENWLIVWLPLSRIMVYVCCFVCIQQNILPEVSFYDFHNVKLVFCSNYVVSIWHNFPPARTLCDFISSDYFWLCSVCTMQSLSAELDVTGLWNVLLRNLHPAKLASWGLILWIHITGIWFLFAM